MRMSLVCLSICLVLSPYKLPVGTHPLVASSGTQHVLFLALFRQLTHRNLGPSCINHFMPTRLRFWGSGSRIWFPHPLPAPVAHVDGVTAASRATTAPAARNRRAAPPRSPAEWFRAPERLPRTSCPLVGQGRTATARRAAPPPPCCRPPPPAAATFPLRPRAARRAHAQCSGE